MFVEAGDESERTAAVLAMGDHPDQATALMGLQWAAVLAENEGDLDAATSYARRALDSVDERTTPWQQASLHTHLSLLAMQTGDHRTANAHAVVAWPMLMRLHADDDALQVRAGMAMAALLDGDATECERILDEVVGQRTGPSFGGRMIESAARAELALVRGDVASGLRLYVAAVQELLPAHLDYPVTGMSLAALAQWLFTTGKQPAHEDGVRLLALVDRFAYNRTFPVMAWGPLVRAAEEFRPGRLDAIQKEYDGRPGRELLVEVIATLDRVEMMLREA